MPPKTAKSTAKLTKSVSNSASKSASKSAKGHAIMVGLQDSQGNVEPFPRDENPNYSPPIKVHEILTPEEERQYLLLLDDLFTTTAHEARSRLEAREEREAAKTIWGRMMEWVRTRGVDGHHQLTEVLEEAVENAGRQKTKIKEHDRMKMTSPKGSAKIPDFESNFKGFILDTNGQPITDVDGYFIPTWKAAPPGLPPRHPQKTSQSPQRTSGKKGGISKTKRISVIKRRKSKKNKRRYTRKNYPGE